MPGEKNERRELEDIIVCGKCGGEVHRCEEQEKTIKTPKHSKSGVKKGAVDGILRVINPLHAGCDSRLGYGLVSLSS